MQIGAAGECAGTDAPDRYAVDLGRECDVVIHIIGVAVDFDIGTFRSGERRAVDGIFQTVKIRLLCAVLSIGRDRLQNCGIRQGSQRAGECHTDRACERDRFALIQFSFRPFDLYLQRCCFVIIPYYSKKCNSGRGYDSDFSHP